jgi:hypothetical protein
MRPAIPLVLASLLVALGCDPGHCRVDRLQDALDAASPGDVVRVGACDLEGSVTVPAGVVLAGQSGRSTVISDRGVAIRVEPGAEATVIRDLDVVSSGAAALIAAGGGQVHLERLRIEARTGIAAGFEGLDALVLDEVEVLGILDADNADAISIEPDERLVRDEAATYGLVLLDVSDAVLRDVTATGFAFFGAFTARSNVMWTGGGASENLRHGLMAHGGEVRLESMRLCGMFSGMQPIATGAVFVGGAQVHTREVEVCENDGGGLLHDGGVAYHRDLRVRDNRDTGVWVQHVTEGFEITGEATEIATNRFGGVVLLDSRNVLIRDARVVDGTLRRRIPPGSSAGSIEVGDGLHLVGTTEGVRLEGLRLVNNARAGVFIDLDGTAIDASWIADLTVETAEEQLGVVAQNCALSTGWDDDVSRLGTAATNDQAFFESDVLLDHVGIIGPNEREPPSEVMQDGLAGLMDG